MHDNYLVGPLLLYSTMPTPAESIATSLAMNHVGTNRSIRLVVLQTPLEHPKLSEVTQLQHQFSGHGVELEVIDPVLQAREDAFRFEVAEAILSANLILVTGGDPARMVRVIADSPVREALREASAQGAVLGGGSAGAMIFGKGFVDGPPNNRFPGHLLGWLPGIVVAPHFGNYPIEPWHEMWPDSSILCLPDESVVLVTDNGTRLTSVGRVAASILDPSEGRMVALPRNLNPDHLI